MGKHGFSHLLHILRHDIIAAVQKCAGLSSPEQADGRTGGNAQLQRAVFLDAAAMAEI